MLGAGLIALLLPASLAQDDCTAASKFIYVMTADHGLHRFNPQNLGFELVGRIRCPASSSTQPYSMAVSRDGTAYVVFSYGKLYAVDTQTAACSDTGFRTGQQGFTAFGMGFTRGSSGEDVLYISTRSEVGGVGHQLGRIDLSTMTVEVVGPYDRISARSELTGDAKGQLYGAFEGNPFQFANINPQNASIIDAAPMSAAQFSPNSANFAFAHWGGDFYLFAGPGSGSDVFRYDPDEGSTVRVAKTPLTIVGAGVSTCAPTEATTEDISLEIIAPPAPNDSGSGQPDPTPPAPTIEDLGVFIEPPDGPLAPGETLTVTAGVRDEGGALKPLDGGTFHVVDDTGAVSDFPGTPTDDGQVQGTIPLPTTDGGVRITFTPQLDLEPDQRLRPEDDSAISLSLSWGLRWDIDDLPTTCFTDQPCSGTARLIRESPTADRILAAPQGRIALSEDGQPVTSDPFPDDLGPPIPFSRTYTEPGQVTWQLSARATTGSVDSDVQTISVREPIVLQVPEVLDFGTVVAGSPTMQSCQEIDLSASTGLAGQQLLLTPIALDAGCESTVQLREGDVLRDITEPVTVEATGLTVCLSVPYCAADAAPAGAGLLLSALDPAFPDEQGTVSLKWSVTARSWLSCNGAWFWPTLGGIAALFVLIGFVRPRRFPIGAQIVTAGSLKGLKRASPISLRGAPGGRAGFYRDARLGVHGDGSVNGRVRGAVALLRATRRGVRLEPRGGVEVYNKRRRQWTPPEQAGLIEPSPSEVFRIGELYFQIEVG